MNADLENKSPWLDINTPALSDVIERLEAQRSQRHIKTHTPLDGIPVWPDLRYITVYRHPIDVHFSFRMHVSNLREPVLQNCFPPDISEGFRTFIEGEHCDGASLAFIVAHYRSSLDLTPSNNLLCLHYSDMLTDLPGTFQKIADFIGVSYRQEVLEQLIQAATFESMKKNADRFAIAAGQNYWKSDRGFFDSASSKKWVGKLTQADLEAYDLRLSELLNTEERKWLEWGSSEK